MPKKRYVFRKTEENINIVYGRRRKLNEKI